MEKLYTAIQQIESAAGLFFLFQVTRITARGALITFCYDDSLMKKQCCENIIIWDFEIEAREYTEEWIDKIKDFIANKNYLHPVIVNIITLAG